MSCLQKQPDGRELAGFLAGWINGAARTRISGTGIGQALDIEQKT
jgi:hypothetical protein